MEHRIHPVGLTRFIWYSNNRINPVLRPVKTGVPKEETQRRNPKKKPKEETQRNPKKSKESPEIKAPKK
ncbi:MAG: hypothetical protein M0P99_03320, partial [Candidatus Cloacimonetes bacterium]|nr:hypothetical protein [Candidatus Cloacimonadota bacterium]